MAELFTTDVGADLAAAADEETAAAPQRQALKLFLRNRSAVFGLILFLAILIMTFVLPFFYERDPGDLIARPHLAPGSEGAPLLGTDQLGRDLTAVVVYGGRTTLRVAAGAAVMIVGFGVMIGALAGFYGGKVDDVLMRFTEFFQVLPGLLFAIVLVALFNPSVWTVMIAIATVSWAQTARLTRAEFLRLKNLEFVKAARAIGASDFRIITRVILPNAMPTLIVSSTLVLGWAILFEAGLAFLGLADVNNVSWGLAIGRGRAAFTVNWWAVTFPGLAIFATVLGLSLIGDGLQDAYNPKLRGR